MSDVIIRIGRGAYAQVTKDPADSKVYRLDWDTENLAAGVTIVTSTWALTRLFGGSAPPLTSDQEAIISGGRHTRVRLTGGAVSSRWRVDNRIVTSETPSQTKERSFLVLIEHQ